MPTFSGGASERHLASTPPPSSGTRIGVLVVDDSALMRRLVTDIISETEDFRVVGVAHDGQEALKKIHRLDPQVVTMDVEMPVLDGLQALGYIMSETPRPVVMLSSYTVAGGELTLRALDYGAVDFVAKPDGTGPDEVDAIRHRLVQALRAAASANLSNVSVRIPRRDAQPVTPVAREVPEAAEAVVAVAASTGGPRALLEVISGLPGGMPAAVLVVQHMPAAFIESFAHRLDRASLVPVEVAKDGEQIRAGRVYLAPGGSHMRIRGTRPDARISLSREETVWGVRPAADPLFESVAEIYGDRATGVVLTGMGRDGAAGMAAIRRAHGAALAQDLESSVVSGMPQASLRVGAESVALDGMARRISEEVGRRSRRPADQEQTR